VTPAQRHANLDQDILDRRAALYETARQLNPLRWKGPTRNWQRVNVVHLNPDRFDSRGVTPQRGNQQGTAARYLSVEVTDSQKISAPWLYASRSLSEPEVYPLLKRGEVIRFAERSGTSQ
jgi:hypothetical protein